MRRVSYQSERTSHHIFMTEITQADGKKRHVISTRPLGDQSIRVNRAWEGEKYEKKKIVTGRCSNSGALFLLMTLYSHGNIRYRNMIAGVWVKILGFTFGFSQCDSNQLASLGSYAVAIRRPPSVFQAIEMDPSIVVDAVMRGQEDMVMNILRANPSYLLRSTTVKNSVDVESNRTPLQAAIMSNDIQMIEKMREHFARIPDGDVIMQRQILQIYKESLTMYYEKQKIEVERLKITSNDKTALRAAIDRRGAYEFALHSDNILDIFDAHREAQAHNIFDFQPYVDAITNAGKSKELRELDGLIALIKAETPEETAAACARMGIAASQTSEARDKAFNELTLVEKLNRFREELVKHMQLEIIFNPHHISEGLRIYERAWRDCDNERAWRDCYAGPLTNVSILPVIFCYLVGGAQRKAPEPFKQDIRQGTLYLTQLDLTQQVESRARPSRFSTYGDKRNSLVDISLIDASSLDGLGYKFGAGCAMISEQEFKVHTFSRRRYFLDLLQAKEEQVQSLFRSLGQRAMRAWACSSVT